MADLEVSVNINANKKSAETFAEQIAAGMQKSLKRLGMGNITAGVAGMAGKGAAGEGIAAGMAGGLVASGLIGLVSILVDTLKDFPIVTSIMKVLKLILMLLFLPLIPLLKPALLLLAGMAKVLAPVMMGISRVLDALLQPLYAFVKFMTNIKMIFSEMVAKALKFISQGILEAWEGIAKAGKWIWENIIKPGFNFLADIGKKMWVVIKGLFTGNISVVTEVWGFIKGLFKGTISVASTMWDFFKSLFSGGGKGRQIGGPISQEGVYYLHKGERVLSATERNRTGGTMGNITVNFNNTSIRSEDDLKKMERMIDNFFKRELRRRVSYV